MFDLKKYIPVFPFLCISLAIHVQYILFFLKTINEGGSRQVILFACASIERNYKVIHQDKLNNEMNKYERVRESNFILRAKI